MSDTSGRVRRLRVTWRRRQATGLRAINTLDRFRGRDGSALSKEIMNAFYPPRFKLPDVIAPGAIEPEMDRGTYLFVVVIPNNFEHDLRAGRNPAVQVNIDATAMQQAGIGAGYIKNIINDRVASFLKRTDVSEEGEVTLVVRKLFNPNGVSSWFKSVVAIINQITLLTVVLTGAAVIRERETDARALAGDAADVVRDRDGEGMGERPRDPDCDRSIAVLDRSDGAQSAVCRFGHAVVRRRGALSVLLDCAGDLSGNDFPIDGTICPVDHPGDRRADAAVRRKHSGRESTQVAPVPHVSAARAPLRVLFPSDHLSRRRPRAV